MLTKELEEDLNDTLKMFVEEAFTSYTDGTTKLYLYFDDERQEFNIGFGECYGTYILSRPIADWRDSLFHSFKEEVQDILTDPEAAEYSYPQEVINSVIALAESEDYDIENGDEAEEILKESGAADVIGEENARYYTEVDTGWLNDLKDEAIEAYEALQKDGAIEPYEEEMEFENQEKEKPSIKAKIKEYQEKESIKAKDKPLKQAKNEKGQEL